MMSDSRLGLQLCLGWLRSRFALTLLAVLVIAVGATVLAALAAGAYEWRRLNEGHAGRGTIELELVNDSETARSAVMAHVERWPAVESVRYVPPDEVMKEIAEATGEDLYRLFGQNPFPPIVRVRTARLPLRTVDSLISVARVWPEVVTAATPLLGWHALEETARRAPTGIAIAGLALAVMAVALTALCFRAQNRASAGARELVELTGASRGVFASESFYRWLILSLLGSLAAYGLSFSLLKLLSWLMLTEVIPSAILYPVPLLAGLVVGALGSLLVPFLSRLSRSIPD